MKFRRRECLRRTAGIATLPVVSRFAAAQSFPIRPLQADKLAASIGLNIKPEDFLRSYDLYWDSVIIPELVASGIRHARVGIEAPSGDSQAHKATYFQRLSQLGSIGVRLSVVTTPNSNFAHLDPDWVSAG